MNVTTKSSVDLFTPFELLSVGRNTTVVYLTVTIPSNIKAVTNGLSIMKQRKGANMIMTIFNTQTKTISEITIEELRFGNGIEYIPVMGDVVSNVWYKLTDYQFLIGLKG